MFVREEVGKVSERQPTLRPYTVEGTLNVELEKFPKEIIDQMLEGFMPVLRIEMIAAYLQDGATIESSREEGVRIQFSFA